jgi:hypothetical protein
MTPVWEANRKNVCGFAGECSMRQEKRPDFFPVAACAGKKNRTPGVAGRVEAAVVSGHEAGSSGIGFPASLQKSSVCIHGTFACMRRSSTSMQRLCVSGSEFSGCMQKSCACIRGSFSWSFAFIAYMRRFHACGIGIFSCMRETGVSMRGPVACSFFPARPCFLRRHAAHLRVPLQQPFDARQTDDRTAFVKIPSPCHPERSEQLLRVLHCRNRIIASPGMTTMGSRMREVPYPAITPFGMRTGSVIDCACTE